VGLQILDHVSISSGDQTPILLITFGFGLSNSMGPTSQPTKKRRGSESPAA